MPCLGQGIFVDFDRGVRGKGIPEDEIVCSRAFS